MTLSDLHIYVSNLDEKAISVTINDPEGLSMIRGAAEIGGRFIIQINGESHAIGPIRDGENWFHIAGRELCIDGQWEINDS